MTLRGSYFMRIFYWDWDEEEIAPVFIKIPLTVLSPSPNMLALLIALENFYNAECYLMISDIQELSDNKIGIVPFGVISEEVMLITTCLGDEYASEQFLCGVTTSSGEYELLALDENGNFATMVLDQNLVDYLDLKFVEEATDLHQQCLEDLGCEEDVEYVYYPAALYK